MSVSELASTSLRRRWTATWLVPAVAQVGLSIFFGTWAMFDSPAVLFTVVAVAASLCMITSAALVQRAFATNEAELGVLGSFFFAVSVLPLVHGLTTPGVFYGANSTTTASVLWAIPVGLAAAAPCALPARTTPTWLRRHWRIWVGGSMTVTTGFALALLADVDLLPAPQMRHPLTIAVAIASFAGCVVLSYRHLRIAQLSRNSGPLVVSLGYGLVGSSAFVWLAAAPFSTAFWAAHAFDIIGVLTGTIGGLVVYLRTGPTSDVLKPVLVTDPLNALELGLDPIVHSFIADLNTKDPITRNHVIRTAELAIEVGIELRLQASQLRRVGLTAILHDVGKLGLPDEILNKRGRLTADEFDVVRGHAAMGEALVASSPALVSIAPAVRGHHERMDGGGYPDGLAGHEICREARIVAVCDAFDAMSNTRQYRDGMGHDKAIAILREHSGSQWDAVVVEALVAVVRRTPPAMEPSSALDQVGRDERVEPGHDRIGCDCLPEAVLVGAAAGVDSSQTGIVSLR